MRRIVLASRNPGKIGEIRAMFVELGVDLLSLSDYPGIPEIAEDGSSFQENALKKARVVTQWTGEVSLADDSGLEVDALAGAPGIYSARYAGNDADDRKNIRKLLRDMRDIPPRNRKAAFRCVLVLHDPDGNVETFEGRWEGRITEEPAGEGGFGYDPVFFLPDMGMTVAQLPSEVKNRISHRAKAFAKLKERLQKRAIDKIGA